MLSDYFKRRYILTPKHFFFPNLPHQKFFLKKYWELSSLGILVCSSPLQHDMVKDPTLLQSRPRRGAPSNQNDTLSIAREIV